MVDPHAANLLIGRSGCYQEGPSGLWGVSRRERARVASEKCILHFDRRKKRKKTAQHQQGGQHTGDIVAGHTHRLYTTRAAGPHYRRLSPLAFARSLYLCLAPHFVLAALTEISDVGLPAGYTYVSETLREENWTIWACLGLAHGTDIDNVQVVVANAAGTGVRDQEGNVVDAIDAIRCSNFLPMPTGWKDFVAIQVTDLCLVFVDAQRRDWSGREGKPRAREH